jgi:Domain of unknown function (DUF4926)
MMNAELFDVIELLADLPEHRLHAGMQGAIVECYDNDHYEVEFTDHDGTTIALCALSPEQFIVVWQAKTKSWLPIADRLSALVDRLPEEHQQQVLNFARSLYPANA